MRVKVVFEEVQAQLEAEFMLLLKQTCGSCGSGTQRVIKRVQPELGKKAESVQVTLYGVTTTGSQVLESLSASKPEWE